MRGLAASTALLLLLGSMSTVAGEHPQSAGARTTSFDHKTGNEWWVEVIVTGSPTKVEARDDGGSWVTLELKSWGAWAKSFHIEPGHRVQFRASWSNGDTATSCWFTHPAGLEQCETTPPPPPTSPYTFTHGGGNEWWVEVKVSPMPGKVEAMDTGGAWTPLSFRSWGEWANSFHIEPGNQVRFRALAPDGVWHESCWFSHPAGVMQPCGTPPPPPRPAWPREGSFVTYRVYDGDSFPNYWSETELEARFTYTNGTWSLVCEGNTHTEVEQWNSTLNDTEWNVTDEPWYSEHPGEDPPLGPTSPSLGSTTQIGGVDCAGGSAGGTVLGPIRFPTFQNGTEVEATAWMLAYDPVWPAYDRAAWDVKTGLALDWTFGGSHGYWGGELLDTDAPLATLVTPRTSWPFEGSFVHYRTNETGSTYTWDLRFTFEDGGWRANCTARSAPGVVEYTYEFLGAPYHMPANVAIGDAVEIPIVWGCGATWDELFVERSQSIMTTRNGAAYKAKVWYADEDDNWTGVDYDAWWDTNTRLLLEWDYNEVQGRVINTDAPLARG